MMMTGAMALLECLKEQGVECIFGYPGSANLPLYQALYDYNKAQREKTHKEDDMQITGAAAVIECLKEQGVKEVFGYPGGAVLPLYDALYDARDEITHYLTAHEQGASHAADGYARAKGRVGVCFATSGPGATNLVTGIATAHLDSSPIVFITGNIAKAQLGTDGFQEIDITGVTMGVTKHNYLVQDVEELPGILREAFVLARSGRPGPVLVDIPKDIQNAMLDYTPQTILQPSVTAREEKLAECERENADLLDEMANLIARSEKPIIMAGGGVVRAGGSKALRKLAHTNQIPVCSTLMGLGAFPTEDPLYLGNVGMHGTHASNIGLGKCDLLIVAAGRFSDRTVGDTSKFGQACKTIHIDIDSAEFDKNYLVDYKIKGDADAILELLARRVNARDRSAWIKEVKDFGLLDRGDESQYTPAGILNAVEQRYGDDIIWTTDVGQHQMWTAQFARLKEPNHFITSGGLGTMGFGLGAAIGAKVAMPDKRVVLVTGDGCFRMNCNELATCQAYGVGLTIIVMNNGTLGMVRQWQTIFYDKHYSQTTLDRAPDFVALAKAYSCEGFSVTNMDELNEALAEALLLNEKGITALVDCHIDIDSMVTPMVGPGQPIEDFVLD